MMLLAASAFTWTSCKENDDEKDTGKPKTNTQILTSNTWKVTSVTIDPPLEGYTDFLELEPCFADNKFNFTSKTEGSGTYTQDEGNDVCEDSEKTSSGEWNFSASEKIINISDDEGGFNNFNIKELSETTFKFSGVTNVFEQDYTITFTYIAQ